MEYISTRNTEKVFSFKDVFLKGLASDGGLFVPKKIPVYKLEDLENLKNLTYNDLASKIIFHFCSEEFSKKESRWGIFLADAYFQIGKINLCIETIKDYLEKSPKDLYLNQYYIQILTLQKNYEEAISHYRFMSANKLIDFSNIEVAEKMAILNMQILNKESLLETLLMTQLVFQVK